MGDPSGSRGRILIVEDEADLCRLLSYSLEAAGYAVQTAQTGGDGLRLSETFAPDLIVLDLMLPDMSGFDVCRNIRAGPRQQKQPAIVILTAKSEEIDRVVGFELGADDYVVKPFSVRELVLRVDARIKARAEGLGLAPAGDSATGRAGEGGAPGGGRLALGPLEIDTAGHHVFVNGAEVGVSALEMRLLLFLFERPGHVRTRRQLLTEVWGYQPEVTSRTVDTHVKRLRDKLGAAGPLIQTVRGIGYRLAEPPRPPSGVGQKRASTPSKT